MARDAGGAGWFLFSFTRGGNVLLRNNGDGTFKNITPPAGVRLVAHSQTATFFDYDGDGLLDLRVTSSARWTFNEQDQTARYYPGFSTLRELAASPLEYNVLY